MTGHQRTRRDFIKATGAGAVASAFTSFEVGAQEATEAPPIDPEFFIGADELTLRALHGPARRQLSFANFEGSPDAWRRACLAKLTELLGFTPPRPGRARRLRSLEHEGVTIEAWVMQVDEDLSLPAYLLLPKERRDPKRAILAIHGHGQAEPCVGGWDEYHHMFALRLAQDGHLVFCPAHRGFGALNDMAASDENHWLDYWRWERGHQFTLTSEAFLYGETLIGQTIADFRRWEEWLCDHANVEVLDVAGISYGGDLAMTYPIYSPRVRKIYASGTMGSFAAIFARCYNAPEHGIPGILNWMDRSDIAGLCAPRPIHLHYGELDVPGPKNGSASYNETVEPALLELRRIYAAFGGDGKVTMHVTPQRWHEIDNDDLRAYLAD
ncbi:MAG: twin-arginine translocation signal domain-containing protein [Phycisphaerales bacterium JB038]